MADQLKDGFNIANEMDKQVIGEEGGGLKIRRIK